MGHAPVAPVADRIIPTPKKRCEAGGCKVISHKENTI